MFSHRPTHFLAAMLATLVVLGSVGELQAADPLKDKPLIWGADTEGGAPYVFRDPANPKEYIGFEVDLKDALAKKLDRPIAFKQTQFDNLIAALERGDIDLAMNGLEVTPDRKAQVRFTNPYYYYRLQLVARDADNRFRGFKDLEGKPELVVGTLENTAASRLMDKLKIPNKPYPGQVEPYQDLANERLDAVLLDLPIALYYAQKAPRLKYAQAMATLKFVGAPIERGMYAIAVRPDEAALADQLDAALEKLAKDGDLRRIYEKWGLWNDDQEALVGPAPTVDADAGTAYTFDGYLPLLLQAAVMTVYLSVVSMALAIALGLPIAISRLYGPAPLRLLALLYVEFFRGIPVLLVVYFLYYGLPSMGIRLSADVAAILAFGLTYAAYEAEICRAGLTGVPAGQWEAAASLGMSDALTFRRVIMPQAIRAILPPMTNDFVGLFKDTSVVSVIAVVELTKMYLILSKPHAQYLEIGLATAVLYLAMSVPLGYLSRALEKRWGRTHA